MTDLQRQVAKGLLSIGAVFLRPDEPFTWASGIKSPIYCDNRLVLTAPEVRAVVEQGIADTVRREFPDAEVLMGTATAGIAHAAIAGWLLGMPMGYVRSGAKDHGRANRIEGKLEPGAAKSSLETVDALREAGAEVLGMVSIFTYGMKAGIQKTAEAGVRTVSLSNLDSLLEVAVEEGYIKSDDCRKLLAFRDDPSDESWMKGGKN